jgi:hypothetical protein
MAGLMDVIAKLTEQTENQDGKGTLTEIAESMSVEKDGPVDKFNQRSFINPKESMAVDISETVDTPDPSSLSRLASRVSNKAKDFLADPIPKSFYQTQNKQSWGNDPTIKNIIENDPIIEKIIQTESSNDPNARSKPGAVGLMQIMEATAIDPGFGVTPMSPEDRVDPVKNVQFGAEYFNALRNKFGGDDKLALMAYNWGYGNVRNCIAEGSDPTKIPSETSGYLEKILGPETLMEEPMGMASLDIEDEITVSNQGGRVERDPYNNYNTQRTI